MKTQAIESMVARQMYNNKAGNGQNSTKARENRNKEPLWPLVVMMVEEHVAPKTMILPGQWHVYSEIGGSFCQLAIEWLGYEDKLPEGYESKQHLWLKVRQYVNEALGGSRNGCRLRMQYKWKGENWFNSKLF